MKVYSKFKDYYDSASSFGVDETIVYKRVEEPMYLSEIYGKKQYQHLRDEIQKIKNFIFEKHKYYSYDRELIKSLIPCDVAFDKKHMHYPELIIIGFCGNLYPFIVFNFKTIFYDLTEFRDYLVTNYNATINLKKYSEINKVLTDIKAFNPNKLFIDLNTPIFLLTFRAFELDFPRIVKNIELKKYKFYTVKDVIEAHSEIEMFLSNTLVKRDEIKEVSDEIKIVSHGFNKWSFRKEKLC